ncbi:hypothetical protein PSTG_20068 [Puccinia striiformis f. sp. tritici PST-78]|uniref:Uncharacterized protein n=1 Tax=Puccinia striiformis f. sp. tritici PST-78 TaxID=1165861 RepID=A0A0L0UI16_9BASI|nr:hypothetical protein PSTG_20068 [Puccinia striiformis f. sp. tritici PST-78]
MSRSMGLDKPETYLCNYPVMDWVCPTRTLSRHGADYVESDQTFPSPYYPVSIQCYMASETEPSTVSYASLVGCVSTHSPFD